MTTVFARSRMLRVRGLRATGMLFAVFAATGILTVFSPSAWGGTYASSKSPYWKVGTYDDQLTRACRRGRFNQIKTNTYNILFVGTDGQAITGIAKKGWNLIDPGQLAVDGFTFHFFNDGYSDCRVYVAK